MKRTWCSRTQPHQRVTGHGSSREILLRSETQPPVEDIGIVKPKSVVSPARLGHEKEEKCYSLQADLCQGFKKVRNPGFAEFKVWDLDGS